MTPAPPARTPLLLAIDGRSGAGKTSLALETAALLRPHLEVAVFHLDSIYPGWDGLAASFPGYVRDVATPLAAGRTAHWDWWDWTANVPGRPDATRPADVVILEGVGAGNRDARPLLDAVAWVRMGDGERKRRALRRDGAVFAAHWDRWAAQEDAYLAEDDVATAAWLVVDGRAPTPDTAVDLVEGLRSLPGWENVLGLVPSPAPVRWEHRTLTRATDPQLLFAAAGGPEADTAMLLESTDRESTPSPERSRHSLLGIATAGSPVASHTAGCTTVRAGHLTVRRDGPFFPWLATVWPGTGAPGHHNTGPDAGSAGSSGPFRPGWMGWIGYGIKRESGSPDGPATLAAGVEAAKAGGIEASMAAGAAPGHHGAPPEALLFRPGRGASVDHVAGTTTLFWNADDAEGPAWAEKVARAVSVSAGDAGPVAGTAEPVAGAAGPVAGMAPPTARPPVFTARDTREEYLAKIRAAQHEIYEGNTYEACLTTQLDATVPAFDGWDMYRRLAAANRAPFNLYVRAPAAGAGVGQGMRPGAGTGPAEILSTSPERFLSVSSDGWLVTEPIKGTRPRGTTPDEDRALAEELVSSVKDRAENIMITDLARNDLSRFARPGTLATTRVCAIESYPTVHQMVSTVTAQLLPGVPRADALAAAFPPGSMTGAPKISTMDILERLESGPRGVYSGVAGYLSADGAADLNVLIRTLVAVPEPAPDDDRGDTGSGAGVGAGVGVGVGVGGIRTHLSLGLGGAITADSVPEEEWDEVRTKAHGVLRVLGSAFPND